MTQLLTTSSPDAAPRRTSRNPFANLMATVKQEGLFARSYAYYWTLLITLTLVGAGLLTLSALIGDSWWQIAIAVGIALVMTQFGFLGHDAAHRQIFTSARWSDGVALVVANLFVGLGISWWKKKHTRHHGGPNKMGVDSDIDNGVVAFTPSDEQTRLGRWMRRRQVWFFFPIVSLVGLQMDVNSFKHLFARGEVKNRWLELALLTIHHAGMTIFAFWAMSPAIAITFLVVHKLVFGFYLGMVFATNHIGRPTVGPDVKIDFLRRQVLMSRNISGGPVVSFLMGGLNHQIEHHLFPSMSRPNLARVVPIVKDFCREQGIDYHATTLWQGYVEVARHIDEVGHGDIDMFECPIAAAMAPANHPSLMRA
ncbi:fatty acid desaturase family protein [Parenemella sanctibonifatiensis]|uniref:Acyl-CoA desaturase n=1 Tax=Parenemella sanctibonifatiensis TaxID=2016505 RepID=A0A255EBP1_9ACTN|nr:acyl-CoA desaturase [Parenemella sanctibonifatiensis]OYN87501.1 acyl-CoA desaturase [Parenemella sanctibonifatiensis]OYN88974.1 acyl-CoA desaturase [Parenemella sanctibonifatiensis]